MQPKLGETVCLPFAIEGPDGSPADADSAVTVKVFENSAATPVLSVTATNLETGAYVADVPCTTGNGFEAGKAYSAFACPTVGGVAKKAPLVAFQVRAYSEDDTAARVLAALPNAAPGAAGGLAGHDAAAAIKAKTDGLNFAGADVMATLDGETVSLPATPPAGYGGPAKNVTAELTEVRAE